MKRLLLLIQAIFWLQGKIILIFFAESKLFNNLVTFTFLYSRPDSQIKLFFHHCRDVCGELYQTSDARVTQTLELNNLDRVHINPRIPGIFDQ